MKLHDNKTLFQEAIQATATKKNIPDVFVEKDYWVTWVLRNLSKSANAEKIVFKGGTSLSKAYKLIERFSEDVDLAVLRPGENQNQTKKLIDTVSKMSADSVEFVKGSKFPKLPQV